LRGWILSGCLLAAPMFLAAEARAADMFSAPVVELLPVGDAVADGKTPVTLNVLALGTDGQPINGLRLRPSVQGGTAGEFIEIGGGLYKVDVTPTVSSVMGTLSVTLKGKTDDRHTVSETALIPLRPAPGVGMSVATNPEVVVLSKTPQATLSFGLPTDTGSLRVAAGTGEVANITNMGGGRYSARFAVPKVNYPHLAILTAVDPNNPAAHGWAVIPLFGSVDYPVTSTPNANVILKIGGREFGPIQANAQGKAGIPVEVPPGVSSATLISVVDGRAVEEAIDLRVPETKRLQLFPLPKSLPATARVRIPVRVVVLTPTGQPDTRAVVDIVASAGTMSAVTHEGNGVFMATYAAPESNTQLPVEVSAKIRGSSIQEDKLELSLLPPGPALLSVNAAPEELPEGATSFKVFAKALDANGKGMSGRNIVFRAAGAKLKDLQDMRGGDYRADFAVTSKGKIEVHAHVTTPASDNPLRHVLVLPTKHRVANDGSSPALINILTLDAYGAPLANVPLKVAVEQGDGAVPETVNTDGHGIAQVSYVAGIRSGLIRISASGDGARGAGALLQAPEGAANVLLPISGSAGLVILSEGLRDVMPYVEVTQEGGDGSMAAIDGSSTGKGIITALNIKVSSATVEPGMAATILVKATDSGGQPVSGKTLNFASSAGEFEGLEDLANGQYKVTFKVSAEAKDEAKVKVTAGTGATASVVLPVVEGEAGADAAAWGELTGGDVFTEGEDPSVVPEVPDPGKVPREKAQSDRPWLRVRASGVGSSYSYTQTPSETHGSLLPEVLSVGKQAGGKNATPVGAEGHARIWVPSVPYVGADINLRGTRYAIAADVFQGEAADWLYDFSIDAAGRIPFTVGSDEFWIGARTGFRYTDFMIFRGCLDPDCTVTFEPLTLPGLDLGLDVGAEIGDAYFVASTSQGVAFPFVRYATSVDVNGGYQIVDNFFVDLGFTGMWRNVEVIAADTAEVRGNLSDSQVIFKGGVGFSL
jgi:hypothetical protein